jgi:hypothetical protein
MIWSTNAGIHYTNLKSLNGICLTGDFYQNIHIPRVGEFNSIADQVINDLDNMGGTTDETWFRHSDQH